MKKESRRPVNELVALKAAGNNIFTSGEAAAIIGCAPRTVSKWMEAGAFPNAYRLPATDKTRSDDRGRDRRIPREDLIAFIRKYRMVEALKLMGQDYRPTLVAVAGVSVKVIEFIQGMIADRQAELSLCPDVFDLADLLVRRTPDVLVLDRSLGRAACRKAVSVLERQAAQEVGRKEPVRACVVLGESDPPDADMPNWVVQKEELSLAGLLESDLKPALRLLEEVA